MSFIETRKGLYSKYGKLHPPKKHERIHFMLGKCIRADVEGVEGSNAAVSTDFWTMSRKDLFQL